MAASLFEACAAQLIEGRSHGWAKGFLSGLLIGGEMATGLALSNHGAGRITLIGDPALGALYRRAAVASGVTVETFEGESAASAGLKCLRSELERLEV